MAVIWQPPIVSSGSESESDTSTAWEDVPGCGSPKPNETTDAKRPLPCDEESQQPPDDGAVSPPKKAKIEKKPKTKKDADVYPRVLELIGPSFFITASGERVEMPRMRIVQPEYHVVKQRSPLPRTVIMPSWAMKDVKRSTRTVTCHTRPATRATNKKKRRVRTESEFTSSEESDADADAACSLPTTSCRVLRSHSRAAAASAKK